MAESTLVISEDTVQDLNIKGVLHLSDLYALTQFYNRSSEVLLITETESVAETRFKELYNTKQLAHLQTSAFFIEKFQLNQHRYDWVTVVHNIEDKLPQELKRKEINDWDEDTERFGSMSTKIMSKLSILGCLGFFNTLHVYCNNVGTANLWRNHAIPGRSVLCKNHGCNSLDCKCSNALDEIFKELEKEGNDVFYSVPKSVD